MGSFIPLVGSLSAPSPVYRVITGRHGTPRVRESCSLPSTCIWPYSKSDCLALALLRFLLYIGLVVISTVELGGAHQGLHVAMEGVTVVTAELGIGSLQRRVSRGLGLLDTAQELVCSASPIDGEYCRKLTRCGAPCASGCAARNSLTL